jgi:hypothetical protein
MRFSQQSFIFWDIQDSMDYVALYPRKQITETALTRDKSQQGKGT